VPAAPIDFTASLVSGLSAARRPRAPMPSTPR